MTARSHQSPTAASDRELARAAATGDAQACRRLAERLIDLVRATSFYLACGRLEADDYAQLSMVEIIRSVGSFRGESSLEYWAERIAVRTTMRHIKRARAKPPLLDLDAVPEIAGALGTDGSVDRQRVSERVAVLLDALKPKQREAVVLKLLFGYTLKEVAAMTDTHPDTVDYRLRTGRKQLRRKVLADPMLREWIGDKGFAS